MNAQRILRHLWTPAWRARRAFPAPALATIETTIGASEKLHSGQIGFAVEAALDLAPLVRGQTARSRALDVYSQLRLWDTPGNNGVLIYLLLADRDVEIVADRAIDAHVGAAEWERICRVMETEFAAARFAQGVLAGIGAVSAHLIRHYPRTGANPNAIPDRPVLL